MSHPGKKGTPHETFMRNGLTPGIWNAGVPRTCPKSIFFWYRMCMAIRRQIRYNGFIKIRTPQQHTIHHKEVYPWA